MNHYKHLTLEEREKIMLFLALGYSLTAIAKELGYHKATISREVRRNKQGSEYLPCSAQKLYEWRRLRCRPKKRLHQTRLFDYVKDKFLNHQWSPEQIVGRLRWEGSGFRISCHTIYRAIYAGMFDERKRSKGNRGAIRKLRHRGKSRHTKDYTERRGKIVISNPLSQRPEVANARSRLGDWEADTVIGRTSKPCLLTLVDRKSRFLFGCKCAKKRSDLVSLAMIDCLKEQPHHSITPDRGKEFSRHVTVTAALDQVPFYFPLPSHPWDRGTNENTNGLLREYFPKGFDFADVSEEHIQQKVDALNRRPRKCLGFKTPFEVYYDTVLHLV